MIELSPLKEALKRLNQANRRFDGRDTKIANKREQIEALDTEVREAKDREAMNTAMKKLNRAHAALDRIIDTGHSNAEEIKDELDKLIELAQAERHKL